MVPTHYTQSLCWPWMFCAQEEWLASYRVARVEPQQVFSGSPCLISRLVWINAM
jgi:hypothetical protein